MENLEVFLINLFMLGENFSNHNNQRIRDTTVIECEGFKFEFKQLNIHLKQSEFINQSLITTKITIENISSDQVEHVLEVIDDLCWLLSFAQQSPVRRYSHKIGSAEYGTNCSGAVVNPLRTIIEDSGKEIRNFIEQTYPTFKKLKSIRQLTVVFGYLCEANRSTLALEITLISHYVAIENLKNTFALEQGYKYKDGKYSHNLYGKCSSTEMTKRMFEAVQFNREEIAPFLKKRNKMIHEGILLPFGDENYMEQAIEDRRDVSDLLRKYLLTLLNYKGAYYLSQDRLGASGYIP
ncbi:hypothetical protein [Acinetobacter sp. NigerLNRRAM0016]